jgi:hypothetical protein
VGRAVLGERELALGMAHHAFRSRGQSDADADAAVQATRAEEGTGAAAGGAPRADRTTAEPIADRVTSG